MTETLVKLSASAERWARERYPGLSEGAVAYLVTKMNLVGVLAFVLQPKEQGELMRRLLRRDAAQGVAGAVEVLAYYDDKGRLTER